MLKENKIAEAKDLAAVKAKTIAEAKDAEVKRLVEARKAYKVMNELLGAIK